MKRGIQEFEDDFFAFVEGATSKIRKVKARLRVDCNFEDECSPSSPSTEAARGKFLDEMEKAVSSLERESSEETSRVGMTVFSLENLYETCLALYNQQNEALEELQGMVLQLGVNPYPKRGASRKQPPLRESGNDSNDTDGNKYPDENKENDEKGESAEENKERQKEGNDNRLAIPPQLASSLSSSTSSANDQQRVHKRAMSLADFGISKETQMAILANKKSGERSSLLYEYHKDRRDNHSGRNSISSESILSRADSILDASRRLTASASSSHAASTRNSNATNINEPVKTSKSLFLPAFDGNNDSANTNGLFPICRINKFKK